MGFDVSGLNPQRNKTTDEFPILDKWNNVSWQVREESKEWKKEEDKYWKEWDELNNLNPGVYFRNNVLWWRPLWNYCYKVCEDILTEEDWEQGSWNDGHEYSEEACIEMATRLQEEIDNGHCKAYEDSYKKCKLNYLKNLVVDVMVTTEVIIRKKNVIFAIKQENRKTGMLHTHLM